MDSQERYLFSTDYEKGVSMIYLNKMLVSDSTAPFVKIQKFLFEGVFDVAITPDDNYLYVSDTIRGFYVINISLLYS